MYADNINHILEAARKCNDTLDQLLSHRDEEATGDTLKVRTMLIKQVIMEVDNSMSSMHDILDSMELVGDNKNHTELDTLVRAIEDKTNTLIEYMRSLGQY